MTLRLNISKDLVISGPGSAYLRAYIGSIKRKTDLIVTITEYKPPRSDSQSNYFHSICDKIAEKTKTSPYQIKIALKSLYGPEPLYFGNLPVLKSTTTYSKSQMTDLITGAIKEANGLGIWLP